MPRAEPTAARGIAIRHLFRHLMDENELLRNPLVGSDVQAGRLTLAELRARVAHAAALIAKEDATAGKGERGRRQAACLLRCDLGAESVEAVASNFGLSRRQMTRERQQAWSRAVQHIVLRAPQEFPDCLGAMVNGRSAALFRAGRPIDAAEVIFRHNARLAPEQRMLSLCNLARMQYLYNDPASATDTFRKAGDQLSEIAHTDQSMRSRLRLAMLLLDRLTDKNIAVCAEDTIHILAREAALESPAVSWASEAIVRLMLSLAEKCTESRLWRSRAVILHAVGYFTSTLLQLDADDYKSLYSLRSQNEWTARGFNVATESNAMSLLHLALAQGWIDVVVETAATLAAMYHVTGSRAAASSYRDMVFSTVSLCESSLSLALAYESLAIAALDTGNYREARIFLDRSYHAVPRDGYGLRDRPTIEGELLIRGGSVDPGMKQAYDMLRSSESRDDLRAASAAARIVALGFQAAGDQQRAMAAIEQSLALVTADGQWYCVQRTKTAWESIASTVY